jgi:outer membrane protein assembly factor BamD (BamD/ComL family)
MSIASIGSGALSGILSPAPNPQSGQGKFQQIQKEFQQLGQDLQTGNLTQAQQDFATLSQNLPAAQSSTTASTANNSNPIAQAFNALSQDLQTGNISAAQKDYATIQQDFQQQQQQQGTSQVHHHHHHGGGDQQSNQISQALNSLSAALQSNNLSNAQTAFATLQQDLQQFESGGSSSGSTSGATPSYAAAGSLNVTA